MTEVGLATRTRVMLVDDHSDFRNLLVALLEGQPDLEVVAQAGSLAEARSQAATAKFDVVVLDLGLPDGNGANLIGELREASPRGAVLIMSASLHPTNIERAMREGADEVLDKLASPRVVVGTVRRLGNAPLHLGVQLHRGERALGHTAARVDQRLRAAVEGHARVLRPAAERGRGRHHAHEPLGCHRGWGGPGRGARLRAAQPLAPSQGGLERARRRIKWVEAASGTVTGQYGPAHPVLRVLTGLGRSGNLEGANSRGRPIRLLG